MKLADFYYDLPPRLIAQEPCEPRDHARLMVVAAASDALQHRRFFELEQLLRPGDVLVLNATRVFPARLKGNKSTGGKADVLLLGPLAPTGTWRALVRGATKPSTLHFNDGMTAQMERSPDGKEWHLHFSQPDVMCFLEQFGEMPLPPYIKRAAPRAVDKERYQTTYASAVGAVAAPTAGFHFTLELLSRLKAKGIETIEVVLHVGWGTFRPVRTETIEEHAMLPEIYEVKKEAAQKLNAARSARRRVIAVGTTAVRTLETIFNESKGFEAGGGQTNLFIYPGYRFRAIDALITNFHLSDSTPLLLACAFKNSLAGKREPTANPFSLKDAYTAAIEQQYRFYSYGDAMLIE